MNGIGGSAFISYSLHCSLPALGNMQRMSVYWPLECHCRARLPSFLPTKPDHMAAHTAKASLHIMTQITGSHTPRNILKTHTSRECLFCVKKRTEVVVFLLGLMSTGNGIRVFFSFFSLAQVALQLCWSVTSV